MRWENNKHMQGVNKKKKSSTRGINQIPNQTCTTPDFSVVVNKKNERCIDNMSQSYISAHQTSNLPSPLPLALALSFAVSNAIS